MSPGSAPLLPISGASAYAFVMTSGPSSSVEVSVVIATRDRQAMIRDCVAAILGGDNQTPFEIIVVDDSEVGRPQVSWQNEPRVSVLSTYAAGTSHARNAGISLSRGECILFTDDDTFPASGWVDAAAGAFRRDPELWGLEGPVRTLPWDPLYEYSIQAEEPGHYWGCNVAYRRDRIDEIGGFRADRFPVFGEDRDLGIRMRNRGPIGFSDAMVVTHRPRAMRIRDFVVKPARVHADLALLALELKPTRRWLRLRLLLWTMRAWWGRRPLALRQPRRFARWALIIVVQTVSVAIPMLLLPQWIQEVIDDGR